MKRRTLLGSLAPAVALATLNGCKHLVGLLPVIADIIGDITKAQKALAVIDAAAQQMVGLGVYRKSYIKYKALADDALSALLLLAQGAEQATEQQFDAAWDRFRAAYETILDIITGMGVAVQFVGQETLQAKPEDGMPLITIPAPADMRRTQ